MSENRSGPRRGRPETSAAATAASVVSDDKPTHRQDSNDTLFGVAGSSYGSPSRAMLDDELTGPERRDRGQQRAATLIDNGWKTKANRAIDTLAATGDNFTAEDVRRLVADDAISPAAFGAIFSAAAKQGRIRKTGYTQAQRASRNAGLLAIWRGVR